MKVWFFSVLLLNVVLMNAQDIELIGKAKVMVMDKVNSADSVVVRLSDGTLALRDANTFKDADANPSNEIQSLSLSGNTMSLSLGGGSVNLGALATPWIKSGSNLYYNAGNVGIGDASPLATLTVGNGDKLQVHGSDGDVVFADDQGSIRFANSSGANAPMIEMFQSGTNNSTRMLLAHSPAFPAWGIMYNDTSDAFDWIGDNIPVLRVQLAGQQRVGVGTFNPEAKMHIVTNSSTGIGQLKLTETQYDYARITMANNIHNNFWDIAALTDTNLTNAKLNFFHSNKGDILTINALGRVGINDSSPAYPLEINGDGSTRTINLYNTAPTTTGATFNYGVIANLAQAANTGFPRLFNLYGFSTDADAYLSYGVYGFASNASNFNYGVYGVASTTSGYAGYFSGNVYSSGVYNTSDPKLKRGIAQIEGGLETILAITPISFHYRTEDFPEMNFEDKLQFGFDAEEIEGLLPSLVKESFQPKEDPVDDTKEAQGTWFKAVNYQGIIPILVQGMKEQQEVILDLESRIARLEKLVKEMSE